jgi:carbonic anhydrase/acetyltransferase-like protein (isoleucine patch superfamily)
LVPLYLILIVGAPFALVVALVRTTRWPAAFFTLMVSPAIYAVAYMLIAGTLSRLTIRAITPGRYPRDVGHEVYGPRRLYALCWTAIYHCAPIYHAILAIPALKRCALRLFGYRGSVDFETYPDTWLRDLPLLSVGKGAYLSNKATVSPTMYVRNGKIIVLPVSIGARTMIGHLTMIAPGVDIGADSEVGAGAALGVNACVGSHTLIDHEVILDHESTVGDRCVIGTRSYVGHKAVIRSGLRVPPATVVPPQAILTTQADVDALVHRIADGGDRPAVRLALARGE